MRLSFDKKLHAYKLDGKPITGVTSILSVIAKDALIQWAANEAVNYIIEKKDDLDGKFDEVMKEARSAHRKKKEKAADVGTLAHEQIEKWITGEEHKSDNEMVNKMVENFKNWATKNKVKFLASEKQVFSEKYWYCGTLDFLCEIDGKKYLGDIKTSSGIWPTYWPQCAAYQNALEEMEGDKIDGMVIINIKKDGKFDENKDVKFDYDYDVHRTVFMGALAIYRNLKK